VIVLSGSSADAVKPREKPGHFLGPSHRSFGREHHDHFAHSDARILLGLRQQLGVVAGPDLCTPQDLARVAPDLSAVPVENLGEIGHLFRA
jgi:hypothetical protein